jgi:hypothetical protein
MPYLPGSRGTQPCGNCGAAVPQSDRYPVYLCAECTSRAVDEHRARVTGTNVSLGGGFQLLWPDGEHPPRQCLGARVFVDGRPWWYTEARFGGTLLLPVGPGRGE